MKSTLLSLALAAAAALPSLGAAQVNPAFSDLAAATEQARSILQSDRRQIVSQGLSMTATEAAAFWPLYDRYMADLKSVGDLRVKVISDYAAHFDNLSDDQAKQLVKDYLKYQEDVVKLRKKYLDRFRKVLPDTQVARFYQIENKMDAILNFALARQIPLVPQAVPSQPLPPPG